MSEALKNAEWKPLPQRFLFDHLEEFGKYEDYAGKTGIKKDETQFDAWSYLTGLTTGIFLMYMYIICLLSNGKL